MKIIDEIKKLDWKQYIKYLRYMLGYEAFLKGDTFIHYTYNKTNNIVGSYRKKETNDEIIFVYKSSDLKNLQITMENKEQSKVNIINIIDINSNYSVIFLFSIIMDFSNEKYLNLVSNTIYNFRGIKKNIIYSFVVGAGISLDCGAKKWEDLKKNMKEEISKILKVDLPSLAYDTYDLSQDLKNLDNEKYKEILYDSIYKEYNTRLENKGENPTCEAIANLICKQAKKCSKQRILSFNFDNFLTQEIEKVNKDVCDVYKKFPTSNNSIEVVHLHGLLVDKDKSFDMVLTTDEYYSAYKPNSYVYKTFKNQLLENNIFVGNSLSDYEELKLLRDNFEDNYSSFHYALMFKNEKTIDIYKSLTLLKYGIICLWFDTKYDIANFINNL